MVLWYMVGKVLCVPIMCVWTGVCVLFLVFGAIGFIEINIGLEPIRFNCYFSYCRFFVIPQLNSLLYCHIAKINLQFSPSGVEPAALLLGLYIVYKYRE